MRWTLAVSALVVLALVGGCRDRSDRCAKAYESRDYARAELACTASYERGDLEAGARAAWSAYMQGRTAEVLTWAERLGDRPEAGTVWHLAGVVHRARDDHAAAHRCYERARRIHLAAGDMANASRDARGSFELSWLAADYETALRHVAEAERLARVAKSEPDLVAAVQARFDVAYDLGDYDQARSALAVLRTMRGEADPRVALSEGLLHADEGRYAIAHARFEQSLSAAPKESSDFRRAALLNLVRADLGLGREAHAVAHLAAAEELVDGSVARTAVSAYRARVANAAGDSAAALQAALDGLESRPIADWRWELSLEAGLALASLGRAETAKAHLGDAISVLETLRARHDRSDYKQSLLARKRRPYDALVALLVDEGRAVEALAVAERARSRSLLEHLVAGESAAVPGVARRLGGGLDVPLDEAIAAIGDAVALEYYLAGEVAFVFVVVDGQVEVQRLPAPVETIEKASRELATDVDDVAAARELGKLLTPPGGLPRRGARIYIVADGALALAPLAAAQIDGERWIERNELAFAPSLTTLAAIARREQGAGKESVVLGDPRGDLVGARAEARAVATHLGTEATVGEDATFGALVAARGAGFLHVAAHADASGLALSDRAVGADDIVEAKVGPHVVVLATCSGAAPRDGGLWGSLAAAFLAAGSQVVIASPRSIDDAHARVLALAFYAAREDATPAARLAAAQRTLIDKGEPPSSWALMAALGLAHQNPTTRTQL